MTALQRDTTIERAKEQRLRQLYINQARHGADTQPHVLDEIDTLEKELEPTFQLSNNEAYRLMYQQVYRLDGDISDLRKEQIRLFNAVAEIQKTLNSILVALVGTNGSKAT